MPGVKDRNARAVNNKSAIQSLDSEEHIMSYQ